MHVECSTSCAFRRIRRSRVGGRNYAKHRNLLATAEATVQSSGRSLTRNLNYSLRKSVSTFNTLAPIGYPWGIRRTRFSHDYKIPSTLRTISLARYHSDNLFYHPIDNMRINMIERHIAYILYTQYLSLSLPSLNFIQVWKICFLQKFNIQMGKLVVHVVETFYFFE